MIAGQKPACIAGRALAYPDDDHGAIVVGLAGECSRICDDALSERLRRELTAVRESSVEPLVAVQVTVAARLDEAVGEEAERRAVLEGGPRRLVALVRLDPEGEPARREQADRAVGGQDADRRMPGARGRDCAAGGIDGQAGHRDEVSAGQLAECDLVRLREERGRVGVQADERAERELASAMSAVAAIP